MYLCRLNMELQVLKIIIIINLKKKTHTTFSALLKRTLKCPYQYGKHSSPGPPPAAASALLRIRHGAGAAVGGGRAAGLRRALGAAAGTLLRGLRPLRLRPLPGAWSAPRPRRPPAASGGPRQAGEPRRAAGRLRAADFPLPIGAFSFAPFLPGVSARGFSAVGGGFGGLRECVRCAAAARGDGGWGQGQREARGLSAGRLGRAALHGGGREGRELENS